MHAQAKDGVKILGVGELKAKLAFEVAGASKSAVEAIEKAGGSVKILAAAVAGVTQRLHERCDERAEPAAATVRAGRAGRSAVVTRARYRTKDRTHGIGG